MSKDEDFARRKFIGGVGSKVVWLRFRNTRRRALLLLFAKAYPDLVLALERGEGLVEIVRDPAQ